MHFDAPALGDIYLLCSDGLSGMVKDEEIESIILERERSRRAVREAHRDRQRERRPRQHHGRRRPGRRGLGKRVIELALGLGAAGVTTLGLGIFHPHSTFFGPTLWHGPRDRPQVALTFDDGPHPELHAADRPQLEEQGARGDVLLRRLGGRAQPRRRARAGRRRPRDWEPQLQPQHLRRPVRRRPAGRRLARNQALLSTCAPAPRFYRPVAGVRNPKVHAAARQVGLSVVTWTAAPRDGVWPLTPEKMRRLGARARAGDIMALHDGTLSEPDRAARGHGARAADAARAAPGARASPA